MSLSFFSPSRTVLLIADEALYIYSTGPKGPRLVEVVPWDAENFEENVSGVIAKDCGGKPVLILNDMVEQQYRKERVLKGGVGVLDKSSMIRRKLSVAFPNYPVRAAYALKEKAPRADGRKATDIYIFAAIPESKQFAKTIAAVHLSLASIAGFALLPVEASDMVKMLSAKLMGKGQSKAQWVVFVGQHKNGGLRQVVIKNGELALTRMTPVMDDDSDAEAWAGEVFQEFSATMSYLSRFGFQPEDGLHIIAIANEAPGEALHGMIEESYGFSSLTAAEAARLLNLPLGVQEDQRYADPLHVVWAGRKSKLILPMKSARLEQVSKPRRMATAVSMLLFLGILFLGYQLLNQMGSISSLNGELADNEAKLAQLNVAYQKEVKRKEESGLDVRLVQSTIAVYDSFEKNDINLLPFYRDVGRALGREMRLDKISVKKPDGLINLEFIAGAAGGGKPPIYEASLQMTYPSTTDVDKGKQEVEDLKARLQKALPENKVEIAKNLKDYEYKEGIVVQTGDVEKENVTQDFIAEIIIKGPPEQ